jgi:two-component system, OmpR family, sensor histidine kinase KdpD
MSEEDRPNPEDLLIAIKREEMQFKKGHLKIFLGMSAGVGKTYAMLESAQILHKKKGSNIVVGTIKTHGREETAKLLDGLRIIPEKKISYKEATFEELDIDEIISLKPQIVLIDELAHSNVPGSRHPKRWQDVIEILDNGIDVYTTLNVQHIESLKDVVESVVDVSIRETVPDTIFDLATSIELVDLTPDELLQRLKEGKVYLGNQSQVAALNFFKADRLTALRELVLRFAAEKVDHDLHGMVSTVERESGWKTRERLLAAVSHSPHSQKLIRTTRRLAFKLDAPWIAVYVNDGRSLDGNEQAMLEKNISLARELGAEVITIAHTDIPQAIQKVARQRGVSQIILGRPVKRSFFDLFHRFTLLDRLTRECTGIDIHVIRHTPLEAIYLRKSSLFPKFSSWQSYLFVTFWVLILSGINWALSPYLGYRIDGFILLLGIILITLFMKRGPIIFATILSALIWDYFFIPPVNSLWIDSQEDVAFLMLYIITCFATGLLTHRSRENREILAKREQTIEALYEIVRDIASTSSSQQLLKKIKDRLDRTLNGNSLVIIKKIDNGLLIDNNLTDQKEIAAATWVFENSKEAGWSTSTLPSVKYLYLPLKGFQEIVGVLAFHPNMKKSLSIEEKNFLYTVCQQLGNYLERTFSEERQRRFEYLSQVEKIHQSILNTISQSFQSPIDKIQNAITALKEERDVHGMIGKRQVYKIEKSSEELFRALENITAMNKLNSGPIPLNKEKHDFNELIKVCCENIQKTMTTHKIKLITDEHLGLISFDFSLMELLVYNLIFNAIEYSPPDSTVELEVKKQNNQLILSISDEGEGIPENMLDAVFEKFYRVPGTSSPGLGLGLAIAKKIALAHHGELKVSNREQGGATFSLIFPLDTTQT